MTRHPLPRRVLVAPCIAIAMLAASCGGDDGGSDTTSPASSTVASTSEAAASGAFPVTVDNYFGTATIDAAPTRVVTLGDFAELDTLMSLGVTPAAFGFTDSWATGLTPWQVDAGFEDLEQFDATSDVSPETIASYDPDLILAMPAPADDHLGALQALAPVVGLSWSESWRDALHIVGEATGTTAKADELQAEVEAAIAAAKAELAPYAGTTIMIGSFYGDVLYVQGVDSPVTKLLTELGLTVKPGPEPVLTEYSLEEIPQLTDAEVLLSLATDPTGTAEAESNPLWQALPAVQAGRYTAVEPTLARGMADGFNALSYEWVLPRVVELITATAEGRGTPQT